MKRTEIFLFFTKLGGGSTPKQNYFRFFLGEFFIALKWSICSETWRKKTIKFSPQLWHYEKVNLFCYKSILKYCTDIYHSQFTIHNIFKSNTDTFGNKNLKLICYFHIFCFSRNPMSFNVGRMQSYSCSRATHLWWSMN